MSKLQVSDKVFINVKNTHVRGKAIVVSFDTGNNNRSVSVQTIRDSRIHLGIPISWLIKL